MYDPKSLKAEEFIDHEEILETLDYAEKTSITVSSLREYLKRLNRERLDAEWNAQV